jgi:hypothetical protein
LLGYARLRRKKLHRGVDSLDQVEDRAARVLDALPAQAEPHLAQAKVIDGPAEATKRFLVAALDDAPLLGGERGPDRDVAKAVRVLAQEAGVSAARQAISCFTSSRPMSRP